jgi:hypothetical protein
MINILQKSFRKGKNLLQRRVRRLYVIHVTLAVKARQPDAANVELRRRRANQPLNSYPLFDAKV